MNIFYTYLILNIYHLLINKKRDFGATLLCVITAFTSSMGKISHSAALRLHKFIYSGPLGRTLA